MTKSRAEINRLAALRGTEVSELTILQQRAGHDNTMTEENWQRLWVLERRYAIGKWMARHSRYIKKSEHSYGDVWHDGEEE